jgi:hypothetical protein
MKIGLREVNVYDKLRQKAIMKKTIGKEDRGEVALKLV